MGERSTEGAGGQKYMQEMMERIEKSNAGQEKYARRQYRMSQITAAASLLILAAVCYTCSVVIPKVNVTYQHLELVLEDLETISSELAEADLGSMIQDIDHMVVSSEENMNEALKKIGAIDIDQLNGAIASLSGVVKPLADFFGRFQ